MARNVFHPLPSHPGNTFHLMRRKRDNPENAFFMICSKKVHENFLDENVILEDGCSTVVLYVVGWMDGLDWMVISRWSVVWGVEHLKVLSMQCSALEDQHISPEKNADVFQQGSPHDHHHNFQWKGFATFTIQMSVQGRHSNTDQTFLVMELCSQKLLINPIHFHAVILPFLPIRTNIQSWICRRIFKWIFSIFWSGMIWAYNEIP